MTALQLWLLGLPLMLGLGLVAWVIASVRRNVGLVDIFWSLFFLSGAVLYASVGGDRTARAWLVLALVTIWALRLATYLAVRNWSKPEDHRYQLIRARNEPGFAWKSLYLVFALQAALAWVISAPLLGAIRGSSPLKFADALGVLLTVFGVVYESFADQQLARFKSEAANAGRVMAKGLWRYSRHPNYFGEFCVWWGFYLLAVAAGAWWSLFAPLLMTLLLLKVSGVVLLERDIAERRPAYRDYVARTNAFFPGAPHS
jgi:steroid 5-alpha reductase family enzyme